MAYPKELHKDKIEESAILSAFIQFMNIRFRDINDRERNTIYRVWEKQLLPQIEKYAEDVLKISLEEGKKNIELVRKKQEEVWNKKKPKMFNSIEDAIKLLKEKGINVES